MRCLASFFIIALASVSTARRTKRGVVHVDEPKRAAQCQLLRSSLLEGFHRELKTDLTVTFSEKLSPEAKCQILLKEHLPSGLYVDLYQTENLHQFGGAKVFSTVDIDVELPEYLSQNYTVYIYHDLAYFDDHTLHGNISIPIHVRYHRPSSVRNYAKAILSPPDVLLRCDIAEEWISRLSELEVTSAPCSSDTSSDCVFTPLICPDTPSLTFHVPVGHSKYYTLVVTVTTLVTLGTTALLVYAMFRHQPSVEDSKKTS